MPDFEKSEAAENYILLQYTMECGFYAYFQLVRCRSIKGEIKMIKTLNIKPQQGKYICTMAAVNNVFLYYGINSKEYEVYIISDGFNTSYCDGYVAINSLKEISRSLNINGLCDTVWKSTSECRKDELITYISNGIPIVVLINSDFLNFDSRLSKKYGFLRSFIIFGFNSDKDVFKLYDTFYFDSEQRTGVIDFEISSERLVGDASEYLIIKPPVQPVRSYNLHELFAANLDRYRFGDRYENSRYRGKNAMLHQVEIMDEVFKHNEKEAVSKACYYASNTIRFGTFMPMMGYFIDYFSEVENGYEDLLDKLKYSNTQWNVMSNRALKITLSKRERAKREFIENYMSAFENTNALLDETANVLSENSKNIKR